MRKKFNGGGRSFLSSDSRYLSLLRDRRDKRVHNKRAKKVRRKKKESKSFATIDAGEREASCWKCMCNDIRVGTTHQDFNSRERLPIRYTITQAIQCMD